MSATTAFEGVPDVVRKRMSLVRKTDTKPEMVVRRTAHALGYRFRLHRKDLPGTPDLVFPGRRKAIFVHGCFWHQHAGCKLGKLPKSRPEYWLPKLRRNQERDAAAQAALTADGWAVETIWECETKDAELVRTKVDDFLSDVDACGAAS